MRQRPAPLSSSAGAARAAAERRTFVLPRARREKKETRNWQKQPNREQVEHREQDKAQHPVGRVGNPEDIAQTVDWLIGAGFVTGQAINVDGGMTRTMIYEH